MRHALIRLPEGSVVREQDLSEPPPDLTHKGLRWLPVVTVAAEPGPGEVADGHTVTVEPSRVVKTAFVRAKAADERRAELLYELASLDAAVPRATEDLYTATGTAPHPRVAEAIARKAALRAELAALPAA